MRTIRGRSLLLAALASLAFSLSFAGGLSPASASCRPEDCAVQAYPEQTYPDPSLGDGRLLQEAYGPVYVIYGGAKFLIPSWEEFAALGFSRWQVRRAPTGFLSGVPDVPVDGTPLRERTSGNRFVVWGWMLLQSECFSGAGHVIPSGSMPELPEVLLVCAPQPGWWP